MDEHVESGGLTRGGLLKAGAVAALAAGSGGAGRALAGGAGPAPSAGAGVRLAGSGIGMPKGGAAYFHHATYVPLVGTDFRIRRPGARTLRVQLIDAREHRSAGESFSLLFRAHPKAGVDGGIYRLEHPSLGGFELFVSPVSRGAKGLDLEAVINRIAT